MFHTLRINEHIIRELKNAGCKKLGLSMLNSPTLSNEDRIHFLRRFQLRFYVYFPLFSYLIPPLTMRHFTDSLTIVNFSTESPAHKFSIILQELLLRAEIIATGRYTLKKCDTL